MGRGRRMCNQLCDCFWRKIKIKGGVVKGKIPWTEEPGGLQSMGSLRVGHD